MESLRELRTIIQNRARGSTCIKAFRDVRCTQEETWAIEEGSLVISIPGRFVDWPQRVLAPDEFELRGGEVFVVCLMCADMWALCVRLRLSEPVAMLKGTALQSSQNLKFLPLCSVTLAANYNAFCRRDEIYERSPLTCTFPSGGHYIRPPERQESIEASRRIFHGPVKKLPALPNLVYSICNAPRQLPVGMEFEPFENTSGKNTLRRIMGKFASQRTGSDVTSRNDISSNPGWVPGSSRAQDTSETQKELKKHKSILDLFRHSRNTGEESTST